MYDNEYFDLGTTYDNFNFPTKIHYIMIDKILNMYWEQVQNYPILYWSIYHAIRLALKDEMICIKNKQFYFKKLKVKEYYYGINDIPKKLFLKKNLTPKGSKL